MAFPMRRIPSLTTKWHYTLFHRQSCFSIRCYSTPKPSFYLPEDTAIWGKIPKAGSLAHRVSVRNPATAAKIAEAFVPEGSKDKVIIEAYPGPGQLTRALLNLPKDRLQKLIVIENWEPYLEWLRPLKEVDSRIEIVEMNPFLWDAFSHITDAGMLNVEKLAWDQGVHPQLQFISHLPSTVHSEQLFSQYLRSMPEENWLFAYGRVPLSFILSDYLYKRVVATVKDYTTRCKLSIVAEATASCTPTLDFSETQPYDLHFHPVAKGIPLDSKKDSRSVGRPFRTMTVLPLEKQLVAKGQMDAWDYCLRRLYVKKSTALDKAINLLAPNAQILMPAVTNPKLPPSKRLDVSKRIRDMDARDWSILLKAFEEWPFRPTELSMSEGLPSRNRRK